MKAIKIDPVNKEIAQIELKENPDNTFKELYEIIGCDMVEIVFLRDDEQMFIDEEGRLKEIKGAFTFKNGHETVIAGIGVVTGYAEDGVGVDTKKTVEDFKRIVEWIAPEGVPEPEVKVFSF